MRFNADRTSIYLLNSRRDLCYKVTGFDAISAPSDIYLVWRLELVSGLDYVDVDMSNEQGWCPPANFIDDIQVEQVIQYPVIESLESVLEDDGWTIIDMNQVENYLPVSREY